jgi:hypothetical protein
VKVTVELENVEPFAGLVICAAETTTVAAVYV